MLHCCPPSTLAALQAGGGGQRHCARRAVWAGALGQPGGAHLLGRLPLQAAGGGRACCRGVWWGRGGYRPEWEQQSSICLPPVASLFDPLPPFTPSPPHLPHTHTPTAAGVSGGGSAHSAEVRFAGGQGGAPRTRVGRLHGRWGHAAPSLLLPAVTRPICSLPRLPPSPLPCAPGPLQSPLAPCPSPRPCCTTSCPPATARPRPPCWWL